MMQATTPPPPPPYIAPEIINTSPVTQVDGKSYVILAMNFFADRDTLVRVRDELTKLGWQPSEIQDADGRLVVSIATQRHSLDEVKAAMRAAHALAPDKIEVSPFMISSLSQN